VLHKHERKIAQGAADRWRRGISGKQWFHDSSGFLFRPPEGEKNLVDSGCPAVAVARVRGSWCFEILNEAQLDCQKAAGLDYESYCDGLKNGTLKFIY